MSNMQPQHPKAFQWLLPSKASIFIWLAAINAIAGIFLLDWNVETILFSFVYEGFVIGFVHFIKLWIVFLWGKKQQKARLQPQEKALSVVAIIGISFVIFLFSIAHLVFLFVFLMSQDKTIENPLLILENTRYVFSKPELQFAFISGSILYVLGQIMQLVNQKKHHEFEVKQLYIQPYYRVFVQQILIIVGGYFFMLFYNLTVIAVCVVIVRLMYENLFLAARENPTVRAFLFRLLIPKKDQAKTESIRSFEAFLEF
ncbi:MAG: hypothetical protein E6Q37_02350 [Crocinitomicaceae bacterium]|nr:MAG: hypothetical protein E6Q37_02350 [Crocinitomicaceae bacterium]